MAVMNSKARQGGALFGVADFKLVWGRVGKGEVAANEVKVICKGSGGGERN